MSAHTPGPWRVDAINPCYVVSADRDLDVVEAASQEDAKLIAAAPDMAEALAWMVKKIDDYPIGLDESNWIRTARAALAKAGVA